MQSVVMHVDGAGVIWAMAKCRECCQVHKYLATDAISKGVTCNSCGHPMELAGAVIASSHSAQACARLAANLTYRGRARRTFLPHLAILSTRPAVAPRCRGQQGDSASCRS